MTIGLSATARGALWMISATILLSVMFVLIRLLGVAIPVHEIIFVRGLVSVGLLMPWLIRQGPRALATHRLNLLLVRGAVTSVGLATWFYALAHMPFGEAVALHFTLPLFGVVLAMVCLKENVNLHRTAAAITGFLGALVILRPGMAAFNPIALVVLLSAFAYAISSIMTKVLVRTESSTAIVFNVSAFTAVVFAIPCLFHWVTPSWTQWIMLIGVAVLNVAAQTCLNRSYAAADASFVMPFDFLRLPFAVIAGLVLFAEQPDVWTIIGATIIFGATYYATWHEHTRN
jgi:drug/metabolite transporter (DMT)-like permease